MAFGSNIIIDDGIVIRPQEDLSGHDYIHLPLSQLFVRDDFSPNAMKAVTAVLGMSSTQLEDLYARAISTDQ